MVNQPATIRVPGAGRDAPPSHDAYDTRFFGHPRGLATLFFTEMWERFSYYGMRAILMLFMIRSAEEGALGFTQAKAAIVYGTYTSLVFLLPLAGGWLADNFFGLRRAVLYGGVIIMLGHISLAMHGQASFFAGLGLVVLGTGLLKPNISAIVGQLYSAEDQRRDSGFSIFYMGINIGAFSAPFVCGYLAQSESFRDVLANAGIDRTSSWHFGFGAAAVGMFLGLVQYVATGRFLGSVGAVAPGAATPESRANRSRTLGFGLVGVVALAGILAWLLSSAPADKPPEETIGSVYAFVLFGSVIGFFAWLLLTKSWTPVQRRKLIVLTILFLGSCIFWASFEQAGSTLTVFADQETQNTLFGFDFPSSWWQAVQPGLLVLLAPLFAWVWAKTAHRDPTSAIRFALGLLFAGLGFAVLIGGAMGSRGDARVSPIWLFTVYLLHTIGELCLSPVGLASMTKLAPQRVTGMMLGIWFASIGVGSYLGGRVAGVYEKFDLPVLFAYVAGSAVVMAIVMALLALPARRLLERKD